MPEDGFAGPPEQALAQPIVLDGKPVVPAICKLLKVGDKHVTISVRIREGRNRHIRRLCEACALEVSSL